MIRSMLAAAALMGSVMVPAGVANAAEVDDFRGLWTAEDHVDGSQLYLLVTGRGSAVLFDDAATVCDGAPAIARSRGVVAGERLEVTFRLRCFNRIRLDPVPYYFEAQPDGTLTSPPDATGFDVYTRI